MDLDDTCPIVDAITDLPHYDKRGVLHDLAHRAGHSLSIDNDIVFDALVKREELGSTGVGNGVAIPHVRLEQVNRPFGIMARLREPIDFNAVDGQPVDLVCLLLLSKKTREPSSPRWPAWPGDSVLQMSFRSCVARPIEWCSITSW
jgi:nitrogen PTS system EIIA component